MKTNNPTTIAAPAAQYSHTVESPPYARWLYTAGQVGVCPGATLLDDFDQPLTDIPVGMLAPIMIHRPQRSRSSAG